MKKLLLIFGLMLVSFASPADNGVVTKPSSNSVGDTISKLETIVTGKGFKIIARVDHAAGRQASVLNCERPSC